MKIFFQLDKFCERPIPYTPYKELSDEFCPRDISFMANKLPSTNLEQFLRRT